MTSFVIFSYIYVAIGLLCGYITLYFANPTDKQLDSMKKDKLFWKMVEKDLKTMWSTVDDYPAILYVVVGFSIILWPIFVIHIFLGDNNG